MKIALLRAAGLTESQIVKVLEEAEREHREQARIRQRNHRARHADKRDKALIETPSLESGSSIQGKTLRTRARARAAKTPFPADWQPELKFDQRTEFERFKTSALAHGRQYSNWDQAWRNWLLNVPKFAGRSGLKERNREILDDLDSFIDQCAADARARRAPSAQTHLLLPISQPARPEGIPERGRPDPGPILGGRGDGGPGGRDEGQPELPAASTAGRNQLR